VRYLRGIKGGTNLIQHYCRQSCVYVSSLICANYGIRLQANQHPAPKPVPNICLFTANGGLAARRYILLQSIRCWRVTCHPVDNKAIEVVPHRARKVSGISRCHPA
jgi:hypothetical protein